MYLLLEATGAAMTPEERAKMLTVEVLIALRRNALDFVGFVSGDRYGEDECIKHIAAIIASALADERRRVWEEAGKYAWNVAASGSTDFKLAALAVADHCEAQAEQEGK